MAMCEAAPLLAPIDYAAIEGWRDDDVAAALDAFRRGALGIAETPPKSRALGISGVDLQTLARLARHERMLRADSRSFFERHFVPHRIVADGFVTGYYEPEVTASRTKRAGFEVPLHRRPPELIDAADPAAASYFDRAAIEAGALAGRGLEIAWLADPVDAFFIHVQGAARLRLVEGGTLRIAFAGKSGHAYVSIGRLAVERRLLTREEAHKDGLEAWLKAHREEGRALMHENPSYIFFRETGLAEDQGPLGAAGVPLTSGRSLAVDRVLHTFHTPVWVDAPDLEDPDRPSRPLRRLMVAQDTGSAIVGPARGDIFFGSGDAAGSRAGRTRHAASMIVLVPKPFGGGG
jgi:membrane-bound lytic murein transglycosylase A